MRKEIIDYDILYCHRFGFLLIFDGFGFANAA
jgi:hypothetical protein